MWRFLITPSGESGNDDWRLRDDEVRGHKHKQALTCTHAVTLARSSCLRRQEFVTAAAAALCMSISLLPPTIWLPPDPIQVSSVTVTILMCVFFFFCFFSPGPPPGPRAAGLKPLALFRDFTSHSVWKGVLVTVSSDWQELPLKEVSTGEAHRDVWRLMYWICCSTGWEGQAGGGGVRTTVWGEEMEMFGETDRCKIQGEREKRGND